MKWGDNIKISLTPEMTYEIELCAYYGTFTLHVSTLKQLFTYACNYFSKYKTLS